MTERHIAPYREMTDTVITSRYGILSTRLEHDMERGQSPSYISLRKMNTILVAFLGAVLYLASPTAGFKTGAPVDACKDMVPQHHTPPQSLPAPYTIKATPSEVNAGETVEVVISGKEAKDTIKGFLLQARHGDTPVGVFKLSPGDKFAQTLKCDNEADSLTHQHHEATDDKRSITFKWTAPENLKGEIKFRSTVALNGGVFWVGVESNPVHIK